MTKVLFAMAAVSALAAASAADATVVQITGGSGQRALTIASFDPVGQIFTATDTNILSFGFQLETTTQTAAYDVITLTLRAGSGFNGAVLATRSLTPSGIPTTRTPTWVDFDLTGTTLVAGQSYTALLASESTRLGVVYGPDINLFTNQPTGGDAYAAGSFIATAFNDTVCNSGICDANFRFNAVTPATAIPEPAGWATMIAGFGLIGGALRRRAAGVCAAG